MTRFTSALLYAVLLFTLASGCDGTGPEREPVATHSFSFEDGMNGWTAHALDIQIGEDTIEWAVEPSGEYATDGSQSLRLYAENRTDAAKIWAERAFDLEPNSSYRVRVEYQFGTSDWGDVNNWRIITGAHTEPPRSHEALTYQDRTDHDRDTKDLVWLDKSFALGPLSTSQSQTLTAQTNDEGTLYAALGVWGTYEVGKTYYVDDVTITFESAE